MIYKDKYDMIFGGTSGVMYTDKTQVAVFLFGTDGTLCDETAYVRAYKYVDGERVWFAEEWVYADY